MIDFEGFAAELNSFNEGLGAKFKQTLQALELHLDQSALVQWATTCRELASCGWHTWEATKLYLDLILEIQRSKTADVWASEQIVRIGEFGYTLGKLSHEPAVAYFKGLVVLMRLRQEAYADAWQVSARAIIKQYKQPAQLLTSYYRVAADVAHDYAQSESLAWVELAADLVQKGGLHISEFLDCSASNSSYRTIPWSFLHRLNRISTRTCLVFLEKYADIDSVFRRSLMTPLQEVVISFADHETATEEWITSATSKLAGLDEAHVRAALVYSKEVGDPRLALGLINNLSALPLLRDAEMMEWIGTGVELAGYRSEAGQAFFDLESARSQSMLDSLHGRVNFFECERLFQLYSEGIVGRKIRVQTRHEEGLYRDLPGTDGSSIFLPESWSEFQSTAQNFTAYKISLAHQLGYYEFATFVPGLDSYFKDFDELELARTLFEILEGGRIDWCLMRRYKGIKPQLEWLMEHSLKSRIALESLSGFDQLIEALIQFSLGRSLSDACAPLLRLQEIVSQLRNPDTSVHDTVAAAAECYWMLLGELEKRVLPETPIVFDSPAPVRYRGVMDSEMALLRLHMQEVNDRVKQLLDEDDYVKLSDLIDPSKVEIAELKKGDVKDAMGLFLTELENQVADGEIIQEALDEEMSALKELLQAPDPDSDATVFYYDEWDYVIGDYRRRFCRLHAIRMQSTDHDFVPDTIKRHRDVLSLVKRQMQMLKPQMQRKVKGLTDGEEIDLERAVEALVDRKAGLGSTDKIYVQRQKKERDVAALFLLDMSASTDDAIIDVDAEKPTAAEGNEYKDDFLESFYAKDDQEQTRKRRIIDLEKESVTLMAEALEELGDNYAICGFSGYGREQVDYYLCKDFNDKYNYEVKGRIGAIKPCRSTRMGPAIRHATRSLEGTDSRVKALIIISDGYPQDFDYGSDRNSKRYGIEDTTKALAEASQAGVQAFCLTVDPSGHDYLREMCPDDQYMVIQDIKQLPDQLARVYCRLTS